MAKHIDKIILSQFEPNDTNVLWLKELDSNYSLLTWGDTGWENITLPIKQLEQILTQYEPSSNKSTDQQLGGEDTSDYLFPTQKAVKSYVDSTTSTLLGDINTILDAINGEVI